MKRAIYTFSFLLSFIIMVTSQGLAQQQKIGYVNSDLIMSNIPEYEGVQQELRNLSQEWKKELNQMQQEIQQMKEDFEAKEILYTDEIRQQRKQEIQQKTEARQQYMEEKFGQDGEYFSKQQELLEPIQRKIFKAIQTIANRDNYDFIFDRSQNTNLLYSRSEWNLNDEVLLELGIELDNSSN